MRAFLLLSCLWLVGCAYYGDMHHDSTSFDTTTLSTPHVYDQKKVQHVAGNAWWYQFKDPQLNLLIDTALSDSPTLQIAEARVRYAQYLANEAGAALWPSLDFSGYAQRQRFSFYGLAPPPFNGKTFNIGTLALNFNYDFDFWGKNRETLKAALHSEAAMEAELAQAQLVLSAAVANTYFQLCNDAEQVKIARANWKLDKQLLQIAAQRTHSGIDSDIPVQTIEANTEATEQILQQYYRAELLARDQLAALLGKNPFVTQIIIGQFHYKKQQIQLPAMLPAHLLARRPDIAAAKARVEAAANRINVAKARFFPDINLNLLYSYQSAAGFGHLFQSASQNNAITGAIDLPIFDAGARRAFLGEKYAEFDSAVNTYNKTILVALREVADQQAVLQTTNSQLSAQKDALHAIERNYNLYSLRYNHGITNYSAMLLSQQLVLQQQAIQVALQTQYVQAMVGMLKALGGHQ